VAESLGSIRRSAWFFFSFFSCFFLSLLTSDVRLEKLDRSIGNMNLDLQLLLCFISRMQFGRVLVVEEFNLFVVSCIYTAVFIFSLIH
jgi:hypothetical protein